MLCNIIIIIYFVRGTIENQHMLNSPPKTKQNKKNEKTKTYLPHPLPQIAMRIYLCFIFSRVITSTLFVV